MQNTPTLLTVVVTALATLLVAACSDAHPTTGTHSPPVVVGSPQTAAGGGERPAPAEQNPVGDIPDTQAFVSFSSQAAGYSVDAPEGWARTISGANAQFSDKLNGEAVTISQASTTPTAVSARNDLVAAVTAAGRAVQVTSVKDVQLPGGAAVLVAYTANSEPDAVTGKQVRLEDNAYFIFKGGKLAMLTLWAPQGADNVDQWQRIAKSFRWA